MVLRFAFSEHPPSSPSSFAKSVHTFPKSTRLNPTFHKVWTIHENAEKSQPFRKWVLPRFYRETAPGVYKITPTQCQQKEGLPYSRHFTGNHWKCRISWTERIIWCAPLLLASLTSDINFAVVVMDAAYEANYGMRCSKLNRFKR